VLSCWRLAPDFTSDLSLSPCQVLKCDGVPREQELRKEERKIETNKENTNRETKGKEIEEKTIAREDYY
jgi:hypothetical protein